MKMNSTPSSPSTFSPQPRTWRGRLPIAFILCCVGVLWARPSLLAQDQPQQNKPGSVIASHSPATSLAANVGLLPVGPQPLSVFSTGLTSKFQPSVAAAPESGLARLGGSLKNTAATVPWRPQLQNSSAATSGPSAPAASGGWSIVPSPNASSAGDPPLSPPQVFLYDVTCWSASDCWAVGAYGSFADGVFQPFILRWDGTAWSNAEAPTANPFLPGTLRGVSCNSASDCWATGYYQKDGYNQTLIQHWDGTSWVVVPSANTSSTQHNVLLGNVSCTSASDCWTVGAYYTGAVDQTLIQHWDGNAWSLMASPNADFTQSNDLFGVTCASASDCWAVGRYSNSNGLFRTLIEHWDGTSWTVANAPNTNEAEHNLLFNVTCASGSNCWAVGVYVGTSGFDQTLALQWNGSVWSIVPTQNTSPTEHNDLYDVTCASPSDCWAVGGYYNGSYGQTEIQHWDGVAWSVVDSPNLSRRDHFLYGVDCTSASDCWALGVYIPDTGDRILTLAVRWDGNSWTDKAAPSVASLKHNYLEWGSIDCVSASDCWAVGYARDGQGGLARTLTEHWDGNTWTVIPSPNVPRGSDNGANNFLYGVDCVSSSDCWAVGFYFSLGGNATLILHWDGAAWSVVPSPSTGTNHWNHLLGVTCASASDCFAVGYNTGPTNTTRQIMIARWNGVAWSLSTALGLPSAQNAELFGATCPSESNCWAVGYYTNGGISQPLIERWDGAAWLPFPSPSLTPTSSSLLLGVTCNSPTDCWAVGQTTSATGTNTQTLTQHWNGAAWSVVPSPNTSPVRDNFLFGVSCTSSANCWAVGYHKDSDGIPQTLVQQWDGTAWSIAPTPNRIRPNGATLKNYLKAVECPLPTRCFATGHYDNDYYGDNRGWFNQTMIQEFSVPVPLLGAVSRKVHGSAGPFDVDLPLSGSPGIECRHGGCQWDLPGRLPFRERSRQRWKCERRWGHRHRQ